MTTETAKDRQARETIEALTRQLEEERAERERFENLFAATCETLGRVKRELGMPDAAIGTEPEQVTALRQERDTLAAHVQQWREAWEVCAETGFEESLEAVAEASPAQSLTRHDAEVKAAALEALAKHMESNGFSDEASGVRAYAAQQ